MDTQSIRYAQTLFEAQIDKDTVESTRTIEFVIASEATAGTDHRNRYAYNWDDWRLSNFNANPIVGYQHNVYGDNMCSAPNPDDVIASANAGIDTYKGKRVLVSKATFEPPELNATAEKVFRKVLNKTLRATSVGILPIGEVSRKSIRNEEGEEIDRYYQMQGQELLEWSIVNIPADPKALRRSLKNHTVAALQFVQRLMDDLSLNDIRKMKVQDVLDAIDKKYINTPLEEIEKELSGPDPNLNKYIEKLNQIKNGQAKRS